MRHGMSMRPSTALARLLFSSTLIPLNEEQCKILPGKNIFFRFLFYTMQK